MKSKCTDITLKRCELLLILKMAEKETLEGLQRCGETEYSIHNLVTLKEPDSSHVRMPTI